MSVAPAAAARAVLRSARSSRPRSGDTPPALRRARDTTSPEKPEKAKGRDAAPPVALAAAVIAVADDEPVVEVIISADGRSPDRLPSAPFHISGGQPLEVALRAPVEAQTGHRIGYLQQLIAFVGPDNGGGNQHVLTIGYLALVHDRRGRASKRARSSRWQGCYQLLPWEDWRQGRPRLLEEVILPRLQQWAKSGQPGLNRAAAARLQAERLARVRIAFSSPGAPWDEDKVLVRFDLLAEAGLIGEDAPAVAHGRRAVTVGQDVTLGRALQPGHRRILAAGIGRLRADLKTRPVVFELMDDAFSLYDLQQTVEAILGPNLHKQNFRRLIETTGLVEPTGEMKSHTGGRPAKLYRFRRDVLLERPAPGLRIRM